VERAVRMVKVRFEVVVNAFQTVYALPSFSPLATLAYLPFHPFLFLFLSDQESLKPQVQGWQI